MTNPPAPGWHPALQRKPGLAGTRGALARLFGLGLLAWVVLATVAGAVLWLG